MDNPKIKDFQEGMMVIGIIYAMGEAAISALENKNNMQIVAAFLICQTILKRRGLLRKKAIIKQIKAAQPSKEKVKA